MQFIAEDALHVAVRNEIPEVVDTQGRTVSLAQRRLFAKFARNIAPQWGREMALNLFEFNRKPEGVTREEWICWYDSLDAQQQMGWTDEERQVIEQKLLAHPDVVLCDKPRVPAPWPTYDKLVAVGRRSTEMVAEKIASTVIELGLDPNQVVAYERENANRAEVIAALENVQPEAEEESGELVVHA